MLTIADQRGTRGYYLDLEVGITGTVAHVASCDQVNTATDAAVVNGCYHRLAAL